VSFECPSKDGVIAGGFLVGSHEKLQRSKVWNLCFCP